MEVPVDTLQYILKAIQLNIDYDPEKDDESMSMMVESIRYLILAKKKINDLLNLEGREFLANRPTELPETVPEIDREIQNQPPHVLEDGQLGEFDNA